VPAPITGLRRSRIYLNTKDEDPPAWTVPVEEALKEAREAADRAKSALVNALVDVGVDADFDLAKALASRLDRLAHAMEGGASYGPFASLLKSEWTGGDSHNARNHRRYVERAK
jgi:hypothetical protein